MSNLSLPGGVMPELYSTEHEEKAYRLGMDAGLAAASWVATASSAEHIARVLAMLETGDPEVDDSLPARPNLSGEWADDATPAILYEEVTGRNPSEPFDEEPNEATTVME